jgi:hypothetical protein
MRWVIRLLLLLLTLPAWGWQWPVSDPVVNGTFGQSVGGGYLRGILISAGEQPVYPVAEGEVIFVREEGSEPRTGLGTVVVVQHERGFRSLYAHLVPGSAPEAGSIVTEETQIGVVGQSGVPDSPMLQVQVIDTETGSYVNPLVLLPRREDPLQPRILNVFAESRGALYSLTDNQSLPAGEYTLLVECSDLTSRGSNAVAPYSLSLLVDGREEFALSFDSIVHEDGAARVSTGPPLSHDALYAGTDLYRLGQIVLQTGRTILEIVAHDYEGNESSIVLPIAGMP